MTIEVQCNVDLCNDNNPCTDDTCTAPLGVCQNTNNTDQCDDGQACTTGDTCQAGACVCSPVGGTRCQGQSIVTCGADGMLHTTQTCPSLTVCRNGLCDDMRCADEIMGGDAVTLNTVGWPRYRHDNRSSGWTSASDVLARVIAT